MQYLEERSEAWLDVSERIRIYLQLPCSIRLLTNRLHVITFFCRDGLPSPGQCRFDQQSEQLTLRADACVDGIQGNFRCASDGRHRGRCVALLEKEPPCRLIVCLLGLFCCCVLCRRV